MPDYIRLLPDSVANQIAAGEVIQRPSSAVKELLENAIDAGSTQIKLIVKDAGRTLIQVIDNGAGMSVTDARMCFERHATSKIKEANDLFAIKTLGFRGEALASIAAVAQVELRTRRSSDELGTSLQIEGSKFKNQEEITCSIGTSILVKNLFFNVPARRNFLKSDAVEFRNILEEFQRVALVYPSVEFSLHHNDKPVFQLSKVNLRQRIVHIFGNHINEKLLPVEMNTEHVRIYGFIGKPEAARKTRGEQYFFANNRYIRHPYLHHAVEQAFEELIPETAYPSYFLFIEIAPDTIDVNIHPTKTEVNFQHGQLIYGSMRSAVKHALGMFSLTPTINFNTEPSLDFDPPKGYVPKPPGIKINPDYNPFNKTPGTTTNPSQGLNANRSGWEKMYEIVNPPGESSPQNSYIPSSGRDEPSPTELFKQSQEVSFSGIKLIQVQNRFIVANVKSGLLIVDQQKAHERILFDRISKLMEQGNLGAQQRNLFPHAIQYSPVDSEIMKELSNELLSFGLEIDELGGGTFILNAWPSTLPIDKVEEFIDCFLEDYKKNRNDLGKDRKTKLAKILSRNIAVKAGKSLQPEEMQSIIDELFSCKMPEIAPDGSRIIRILTSAEIEKLLS
jgi:DNA mismatch repair protein MutL